KGGIRQQTAARAAAATPSENRDQATRDRPKTSTDWKDTARRDAMANPSGGAHKRCSGNDAPPGRFAIKMQEQQCTQQSRRRSGRALGTGPQPATATTSQAPSQATARTRARKAPPASPHTAPPGVPRDEPLASQRLADARDHAGRLG